MVQFIGTPALAGIVQYKSYGSLNYQTLIDKVYYVLYIQTN